MTDSQQIRLKRARVALEGLSIGDSFASHFEAGGAAVGMSYLKERRLPEGVWPYTDDTNMALSIYLVLREHGEINQDELALSFAAHYDPRRGYGMGAAQLLRQIQAGKDWRPLSQGLFGGSGSYGNGAAMRIAPLGAYFADAGLETVAEQARLSAEVTHHHPEGIAGAIAVAAATAWVWRQREAGEALSRESLIEGVLPHVPDGDVKAGLIRAGEIAAGTSVMPDVVRELGNGSQVSAQDTVPFVVWCAGEHLNDFEEAMWLTLSGWGDADTTCAMVGGIVAMSVGEDGLPGNWLERREQLPAWPFGDEVSSD
jgi:ADP-ribosylglycohydrolase